MRDRGLSNKAEVSIFLINFLIMIIKIDQNVFDNAFREMTKYATTGGISILIFVAYDCDAICACHILTV